MHPLLLPVLALFALWLAACTPRAADPAPVSGSGPPPAAPVSLDPAPQGAPPAGVALADAGNTYPGPFFRGRADAPITIDEHADFQ